MFNTAIAPAALADWCRRLRHQLGAGVSLERILTHLSESGPSSLRALSQRMLDGVMAGQSMSKRLEADAQGLPPLFVPLFRVGEETGHLPEILGDLEEYLAQEDRLRRQFRQQTLLPKIQLFLAIFIIAGLIWILGAIATARGGTPVTIFGLVGKTGALIFLCGTLGPILFGWLMWHNVISSPMVRGRIEERLLGLPIVGPCLQAIMLGRFALALQHTLGSGLSVSRALRLSFDATGNAAFQAWIDPALAVVKKGGTVLDALSRCPLLPREFLDMVATAEHAGTLPDMMKHQAAYYQELASERLTMVTRLASGALWAMVAIFIIICIFRIANLYLSALG